MVYRLHIEKYFKVNLALSCQIFLISFIGPQFITAGELDTFKNSERPIVFWVRPKGGDYGKEDGSSYENAWDGFEHIVWGEKGLRSGATLYICGTHNYKSGYPLKIRISGKEDKPITIRGDYPESPGVLDGGQIVSDWTGPDRHGVYYVKTSFFHWGLYEDGRHLRKASNRNCQDGNYFPDNKNDIHYYKPSHGTPRKHKTILTGQHGILLQNSSYIKINGISFIYNHSGIKTELGVGHLHIAENQFRFLGSAAVKVRKGAKGTLCVLNNDLYYMRDGIYFHDGPQGAGAGPGCIIKGNTISYCNYYNSWDGDGHAIGVQKTSGVLVEDNRIKFCRRPIEFWSNDPKEPCSDNIFRRNLIQDCKGTIDYQIKRASGNGSAFIMISNQGNCYFGNLFHNNIIDNCTSAFYFTQPSSIRKNMIYNNTVANCDTGVYLRKGADFYEAINNIFYFTKRPMFWFGGLNVGWNNRAEANLYYPSVKGSFFFRSEKGLDCRSWKKISKQDGDSYCGMDPLFVNPEKRDYHLRKDSPARGKAIVLDLPADYDNRPIKISKKLDLGALKFIDH
ncbi:right-handed parallel beta-helix repeat-containing protein [Desulfobacter latus]|uniref:Right-handed parallel beta-helix repeat-containing protein n=1 Tax=Desulfobacter latus TaxID=2292 RepID=A0A850SYC6_9BACT|nr:right-handed parallel beta-helix repeat-containing protein [Desulfobacter latus]NWH03711.1 right-handed parallel beta-helix repeat-containing protein [Desulfobacter latus]